MRQLSLLSKSALGSLEHGGQTRPGRRKIRRPFDPGRPLHLVLRSSRARGEWSFRHRRNRSRVELALYRHAIESGVELRRLANVGNHLHLLVRAAERKALQRFLRVVSGVIPRLVTGARKGAPVAGRFWDALVYSRVVGWGRELVAVEKYLTKNVLEALGFDGARLRIAADGSPEVAWKDWRE